MNVTVVGGGVVGLCTALCLQRRGAKVTLHEQGRIGGGGSGRSGAILRQHYSNALTVAMARDGLKIYTRFAEWAGGPSGFEPVGCLILAPERERVALEGNIRLMQEAGCQVELLTTPEMRHRFPELTLGDIPPHNQILGAWEPEAGYCDPPTVLNTLLQAVAEAGVSITTGDMVTKIQVESGRVVGYDRADNPDNPADVVVLATGPWLNRLTEPLGYVAPLNTTRPLLSFFSRPPDATAYPVVGDLIGQIYFRPDGARTLVGALDLSHDDPVPDPDYLDETVPGSFIHFCRQRLSERLVEAGEAFGRGGYAGMYDCTPDMHPLIGLVPGVANLYIAAGFSGHGFKLAPVVGRGLAELILTGNYETLDLTPLRPTRYDENAPIQAAYEYGLLA